VRSAEFSLTQLHLLAESLVFVLLLLLLFIFFLLVFFGSRSHSTGSLFSCRLCPDTISILSVSGCPAVMPIALNQRSPKCSNYSVSRLLDLLSLLFRPTTSPFSLHSFFTRYLARYRPHHFLRSFESWCSELLHFRSRFTLIHSLFRSFPPTPFLCPLTKPTGY
jgi:hypothetical protein